MRWTGHRALSYRAAIGIEHGPAPVIAVVIQHYEISLDPIINIIEPGKKIDVHSVIDFLQRGVVALSKWDVDGRIPDKLHPSWFVLQRSLPINKISVVESDDDDFGSVAEACGFGDGYPPEYLEHENWDIRGAIYSLGYTSWILLCGGHPYGGDSVISMMTNRVKNPPISILSIRSDCPDLLAKLVERSMASDPSQRFNSVSEFKEALDKVSV